MKLHGILVLFSAVLGFFAVPAASVYGGRQVDIKDYPHHASLEQIYNNGRTQYIANGAVLSDKIIVTVASAVKDYTNRPYDLLVRVGSSQTGTGGATHNVAEILRYPSDRYDVAVLKLTKSISANNVHSISLPNMNDRPQVGDIAYVSSWGKSDAGIIATRLQHAQMKVTRGSCDCVCYTRDGSNLASNASEWDYPSMLFLTNSPSNGTCDFDDGAPLIANSHGTGTLAGLATKLGFGCYNTKKESMFVDVSNKEIWYFLKGFL